MLGDKSAPQGWTGGRVTDTGRSVSLQEVGGRRTLGVEPPAGVVARDAAAEGGAVLDGPRDFFSALLHAGREGGTRVIRHGRNPLDKCVTECFEELSLRLICTFFIDTTKPLVTNVCLPKLNVHL